MRAAEPFERKIKPSEVARRLRVSRESALPRDVRMWSAMDQPIMRREQMPMTVARCRQVEPPARWVMSPRRSAFGASALKSRISRSGTGGAVLSAIVVRLFAP